MRQSTCRLILGGAVAVGALLAPAVARAETCSLELKRQDSKERRYDPMSYLIWTTYPQHFFVNCVPQPKGPPVFQGNEQQAAAFKRIVKKEPKYACKLPFRSVVKLGSTEYAFVLDEAAAEPKAKQPEPPAKDAKPDAKQAKSPSAIAKLAEKFSKHKSSSEPIHYNRLYFDFNHNGDLTDDEVVALKPTAGARESFSSSSYSSFNFPRVDVTLNVEGSKLDYSFFVRGYSMVSENYGYVAVSFNSAVCREGEITLEGKKHRLVLVDFNSNGRFDDEISIDDGIRGRHKELYPRQGDMLLVDPKIGGVGYDSPYEVTGSDYRNYVTKIIGIDGRFYDLKVTPTGDKLTLTPSSAALGNVTNPNDGFRAVIYGDKGFLKIAGKKDAPVAVPEGEWKLMSYTIDLTEYPKPQKPGEKKPADEKKTKASKDGSLLESLAKTLDSLMGGGGPARSARQSPRYSMVSANATSEYKPVKVVKGETSVLAFGPPYKPLVEAGFRGDPKTLYLEMLLVGSAGEICDNMMVGGARPEGLTFSISNSKGKVVQNGKFEYG